MSKLIISSVSENPAFFLKMPALQGQQELQSKHILLLTTPPLPYPPRHQAAKPSHLVGVNSRIWTLLWR